MDSISSACRIQISFLSITIPVKSDLDLLCTVHNVSCKSMSCKSIFTLQHMPVIVHATPDTNTNRVTSKYLDSSAFKLNGMPSYTVAL